MLKTLVRFHVTLEFVFDFCFTTPRTNNTLFEVQLVVRTTVRRSVKPQLHPIKTFGQGLDHFHHFFGQGLDSSDLALRVFFKVDVDVVDVDITVDVMS